MPCCIIPFLNTHCSAIARAKFQNKKDLFLFLYQAIHDPRLFNIELSVLSLDSTGNGLDFSSPNCDEMLMQVSQEDFVALCTKLSSASSFGAFYLVVSTDRDDTRRIIVLISSFNLLTNEAVVNTPLWGTFKDTEDFILKHQSG